jgi:hypothetical protein
MPCSVFYLRNLYLSKFLHLFHVRKFRPHVLPIMCISPDIKQLSSFLIYTKRIGASTGFVSISANTLRRALRQWAILNTWLSPCFLRISTVVTQLNTVHFLSRSVNVTSSYLQAPHTVLYPRSTYIIGCRKVPFLLRILWRCIQFRLLKLS